MNMTRLIDMHAHLDLMSNADDVAARLDGAGLAMFDCGVDPRDYQTAVKRDDKFGGIEAGLGLHPWWIADGHCGSAEVDLLCKLAASVRFIGEVGLDFSPRFRGTEGTQTEAFGRLCKTLATHPLPHRVMSIHAVRAAGAVLDTLERHGLLKASPYSPAIVFHWFSGASDDFTRARAAECYFSINERMLATKRGREYARQVSTDQMLLETDYPAQAGEMVEADSIESSLLRAARTIADLKNVETAFIRQRTAKNAAQLLALDIA